MPAPTLPGATSIAGKANIGLLVADALGGLLDFAPFTAWLQGTLEKAVPGATASWTSFQLQTRADYMVRLVKALLAAENAVQPQLAQLAALGIQDLFGVAVPAGALTGRGRGPGGRAALAPLGEAMVKGLFGALGSARTITPDSGYDSMLQLVENQLLFAVEGWLESNLGLGVVSKDLPDWGTLDDIVVRTMGLGRVTARAMRPLIDELVLTPATQQLKRTYQSELPSESLAVRLLYRGIIEDAEFFDIMARRGWSRDRAAEFKLVHATLPGRSDLRAMFEQGLITEAGLHEQLVAQGFPPQVAAQLVNVIREDRTRTLRGGLAAIARDMYRDREVDEGEFRALTARAGYSEAEAELLLATAELERSRPKRLSASTMEDLYRREIVQLGELGTFYELEGYAGVDVDRLEALAVQEKTEFEARVARRPPVVPPGAPGAVPRSVALEAHRRGILTDAELGGILAEQGLAGVALDTQLRVAGERRREFADALARRLPPPKGLTTSQGTAEDAYVRGLVGEAELLALYQARGFEGRALQVLLDLRRAERAEWLARQAAQAARAAAAATKARP